MYANLTPLDPSELGLDIRWTNAPAVNDFYIIYLLRFPLPLLRFLLIYNLLCPVNLHDCFIYPDHAHHHFIDIGVCFIIRRSNELAQLKIGDSDRRDTRLNIGYPDPRVADPHLAASSETPPAHAKRD